jgi:6-phosphogluconate dehydrogenase
VKDIFQQIAAKVDDGVPCCDWVGEDGAGHYVKMVHNGIEYGDMQLICEAYSLMKSGLGMTADQMHEVFAEGTRANSILPDRDHPRHPAQRHRRATARGQDPRYGRAERHGWTVISSQDLGIPITLIAEAVYSRCISALKDERVPPRRSLKDRALD